MTLRASGTAEITVGAFSVFVKLYSAVGDRETPLKQAHANCNCRMKQQMVCGADGRVVLPEQKVQVFEQESGARVPFTSEEVKALESDRSDALEIVEFVPRGALDPAYFGKASYLGPDERGADGYAILVDALRASDTAAIGRLYSRGRERMAAVERYRERGLLLRELHYAADVRSFDEIELPVSDAGPVAAAIRASVMTAIENRRRPMFDLSAYMDPYPARVAMAAARKVAGLADGLAPPVVPVHGAARRRLEKPKGDRPTKLKVKGPASVRSLPVSPAAAVGDERPSQNLKIDG